MSGSGGALSGLAGLGRATGGGRRGRRRRGRHSYDGGGFGSALGLAVPVIAVVVALAVVFVLVQVFRGVPSAKVAGVRTEVGIPGATALPWPSQGSAAIAVDGVGLVGSHGTTTALPIASITKVMTALIVLSDHPLTAGASGPSITITPSDVATYQADVATQQSVVAVTAGEQLTELQALEALLIPSGNNIADVLADWDAGSVSAFVAKMNQRAATMGLHHTHFVSPTGLEPGSVSTPTDLITLGEAAMANPVLASIVAMPSVTLPVAGTVYNFDYNVGHSGFVGIKTGSDGQAGGCYLFDAQVPVAGTTVSVIGAVLGQQAPPIIQSALNAASSLVQGLAPQLAMHQLLAAGQRVATVTSASGASAPVVVAHSVSSVGWPGMQVHVAVHLDHLAGGVAKGQRVGTLLLTVDGKQIDDPLTAAAAAASPGIGWKLTNL